MKQQPSIPKGTRDFSADVIAKRTFIFNVLKKHFARFGFAPIETPSFENTSTLMGKYGDEGDQLMFKILNSGDFLNKVDKKEIDKIRRPVLASKICEKALRYDLTIPFARYVVQHQNELTFPFKRYQMQPVWRADRPQKGRFREFYQCDADVVGSDSLWLEVDFIQLYDAVFTELKMQGVTLKLNHRKILQGIAEVIGVGDNFMVFTIALDKLDKIGIDRVQKEMEAVGISLKSFEHLKTILSLELGASKKIDALKKILSKSVVGMEGVADLDFIFTTVEKIGVNINIDFDLTLARGLNYYTGTIFEVSAPKNVAIGSIGGGGRYDDLTGVFGLKGMSGVGVSFGLDRMYLALEELALLADVAMPKAKVLFANFGKEEAMKSVEALAVLRKKGITAELYPDNVKLKKQISYADKKQIPYLVMLGSKEIEKDFYTVKDMADSSQKKLSLQELLELVCS